MELHPPPLLMAGFLHRTDGCHLGKRTARRGNVRAHCYESLFEFAGYSRGNRTHAGHNLRLRPFGYNGLHFL